MEVGCSWRAPACPGPYPRPSSTSPGRSPRPRQSSQHHPGPAWQDRCRTPSRARAALASEKACRGGSGTWHAGLRRTSYRRPRAFHRIFASSRNRQGPRPRIATPALILHRSAGVPADLQIHNAQSGQVCFRIEYVISASLRTILYGLVLSGLQAIVNIYKGIRGARA